MFTLSRMLGIMTLAAMFLYVGALSSAPLSAYIDVPSFMILVLGTLTVMLFGSDTSEWASIWTLTRKGVSNLTREELQQAIYIFRVCEGGVVLSACVASLLELVPYISDTHEAWRLLIVFIPILYAALALTFLLFPVSSYLREHLHRRG